jgi:hypothetical protein
MPAVVDFGALSDRQKQKLRDRCLDTADKQENIAYKLIQWASEGELGAIKVFVSDDRVKLDLYSRNILTYPDRMSVFHMAAKLGNIGIAKTLLDQERMNPNLDEGDSGGVAGTALHIAVRYQQFEMIDFLLNHPRMDVNFLNDNGESALQIAVDVHIKEGGMYMIDQFLGCPRVDVCARPQGKVFQGQKIHRDSFNCGAIHRLIKQFYPPKEANVNHERILRKLLGHHAAQLTRERILFEQALRANLSTIDSDILQDILMQHFQGGQQRIVDPANVDYMVQFRYSPGNEEPPYEYLIGLVKRFVEKYGNLDDYTWEPMWLKRRN